MLRRLILPLVLLIPLLSSAPSRVTAASSVYSSPPPPPPPVALSYLQASPSEGHIGDTIWLSGSGLLPSTQYSIFMACPIWTEPSVYHYGNLVYIQNGPITDDNGQFVRFRIRAIALHHLRDSSCFIYAEQGGQAGYGPDIPAQYHIFPHRWHLKSCAVVICGKINVSPSNPRAGRHETLEISSKIGFGGASVDLMIRFGSGPVQHINRTLDPTGKSYVRIKIPAQLPHATKEQITARFHLGIYKGTATPTPLTIVR